MQARRALYRTLTPAASALLVHYFSVVFELSWLSSFAAFESCDVGETI